MDDFNLFIYLKQLELRRVQHLVGDMQRQRQELSQAVRQLTENSNTLYQQIKPKEHQQHKKRTDSAWAETDLDSMQTIDHTMDNITLSAENLNLSKRDLSNYSNTISYTEPYSGNSSLSNFSPSNKKLGTVQSIPEGHRYQGSESTDLSGLDSDDLLDQSTFGN